MRSIRSACSLSLATQVSFISRSFMPNHSIISLRYGHTDITLGICNWSNFPMHEQAEQIQTPTFRIATEYPFKSSRKTTPPITSSLFADRKTEVRRWVTTQLNVVCLSCTCMIWCSRSLWSVPFTAEEFQSNHCIPKHPVARRMSIAKVLVRNLLWTQSEIHKLNLAWSASAISKMSDSQQESVTTNSVQGEFEQKIDNHCWTFGVGTKRIEIFA